MDFYTGLVLVCMLFAQACCQPLGKDAQDDTAASTVKLLMGKTESMLNDLTSAQGLVSNKSGSCQKMTEVLPSEEQPHAVHAFTFCCFMQEFANLTELSKQLMASAQIMQDLEGRLSNQDSTKNCSLLNFDKNLKSYHYAYCFLQHVHKILSKF